MTAKELNEVDRTKREKEQWYVRLAQMREAGVSEAEIIGLMISIIVRSSQAIEESQRRSERAKAAWKAIRQTAPTRSVKAVKGK